MKLILTKTAPVQATWFLFPSPVGKLMVALTARQEICRVSFLRDSSTDKILAQWQKTWPKTQFKLSKPIDPSNLPILLVGTTFRHKVWQAMAQIPLGQTLSYGALAAKIGKASAARAVGAACGANPVPYFIPCHRVVASTGLGGFSGGTIENHLSLKSDLLRHEGAIK